QGHSGLVAQLVSSADLTYNNLGAQWVSANVADGDAPGVVISQVSPLIVFENATAPAAMQQSVYAVVLSHAPTEDVRVTAAPVATSEEDRLAGALNIRLKVVGSSAPPSDGVTLTFTRTNWFLPQYIQVTAPDDTFASGTRFVNITHTVVQGSSPNDGGAYDG